MRAIAARPWQPAVVLAVFAVLVPFVAALAVPSASVTASGPDGDTTALAAVSPCRLFDSRRADRPVLAGFTTAVAAAGRCDVPADARAVAVTITAVEPVAPGYVTAWGAGPAPATSDVNMVPGRAVANAAIVPLDADGRLRVRPSARTHLIVDVSGAFVPADTSSTGRLVPIAPVRALDTRLGGTVPVGRSTVSGESVRAPLPAAVPSDAVAVAATVTIVEARTAGHVTVHAAGTPRPEASISNLLAGETRAASVVVPASPAGLSVHTTSGGHVLVDVTGWFTGSSAPVGNEGLFVPLESSRLHDSRQGRRTLDGGGTREVASPPVPAGTGVAAWAVNLTAVGARAPGFVTAHPARTPRPETSVLNLDAGATVANAAIIGVSEHGLAAYASSALDLIVDLRGWFTGSALPATAAAAADLRAPQRVLVLSDSAFAGMRWERGATDLLTGAEFHLDLRSCRRLVAPSCIGRDGLAPPTALHALERWPAGLLDTVVVAVGYNDRIDAWAEQVDRFVAAARDRGVRTIVWVALREQVAYRLPESFRQSYEAMNAVLRERAASPAVPGGPRIVVLEWGAYTSSHPGWLRPDGVHATRLGAHGQADTITRAVAAVDGAPCPLPLAPGLAPADPCPLPGSAGAMVLPDLVGLHGSSVVVEP